MSDMGPCKNYVSSIRTDMDRQLRHCCGAGGVCLWGGGGWGASETSGPIWTESDVTERGGEGVCVCEVLEGGESETLGPIWTESDVTRLWRGRVVRFRREDATVR